MAVYTRRTLRAPVKLGGRGLHSGIPVEVTMHPADAGIAFSYGATRVEAWPENVTETTRCTKLGEISTIEHLMSALAGLEITDVEVELSAPELPGLDGSSSAYVEGILAVGCEEIGLAEMPSLYGRIFLQEDRGLKGAVGKGEGHWRYVYATDTRWPYEQSFDLEDVVAGYAQEVARARTFALAEELPMILQMGLGKGLDESSALILGAEGYQNEPRFPDEPARHKLLDLIGDLYLAGVPIRMLNVVAERTGHRANVKLAAMLRQSIFGGRRSAP